jgi:hypothetical protein
MLSCMQYPKRLRRPPNLHPIVQEILSPGVKRPGREANHECKIWGFHGGDYEEWRLLGCYAVLPNHSSPPNAELNKRRICTSTPTYDFMASGLMCSTLVQIYLSVSYQQCHQIQ